MNTDGTAERIIQTINNKIRCLLLAAQLPPSFWGDAALHAAELYKITPQRRLGWKSPHELLHGQPPNIDNLRTFGCLVYFWNPEDKRQGKLDVKAKRGIYLGSVGNGGIHKLWDIQARRATTTSVAVFYEDTPAWTYRSDTASVEQPTEIWEPEEDTTMTDNDAEHVEDSEEEPGEIIREIPAETLLSVSSGRMIKRARNAQFQREQNNNVESILEGLAQMAINEEEGSSSFALMAMRKEDDPDDPDPEVALTGPERKQWEGGVIEEWTNMSELRQAVEPIPDDQAEANGIEKIAISTKWVMKRKHLIGQHKKYKYKARLVARGFSENFDQAAVYAPVATLQTLRILIMFAALMGWKMRQFDISTAFLLAKYDDDNTYIEVPELTRKLLKSPRFAKVKRAMYGLKRAPALWREMMEKALKEFGMEHSPWDHSVFWKDNVILLLYVDDYRIFYDQKDSNAADALVEFLGKKFPTKEVNPETDTFIGFNITTDKDGGIRFSQKNYINRLLKRFGMDGDNTSGSPTPANPKVDLDAEDIEDNLLSEDQKAVYIKLLGCLSWVAIGSRPDIQHTVRRLCKYNRHPLKMHMTAARRVLEYLKMTRHFYIKYNKGGAVPINGMLQVQILAFTDADWAGDKKTRKSVSGFTFFINGAPVHWKSRQQKSVATSSLAAEFIAASMATEEAIWIRGICGDIVKAVGYQLVEEPVQMRIDNQGALKHILSDTSAEAATRHIAVKLRHVAYEQKEEKSVNFEYVKSEDNIADILTKPLFAEKHHKFTLSLMSRDIKGREEKGEEGPSVD